MAIDALDRAHDAGRPRAVWRRRVAVDDEYAYATCRNADAILDDLDSAQYIEKLLPFVE